MVTLEDKKDGCSTDLYFEKQERGEECDSTQSKLHEWRTQSNKTMMQEARNTALEFDIQRMKKFEDDHGQVSIS